MLHLHSAADIAQTCPWSNAMTLAMQGSDAKAFKLSYDELVGSIDLGVIRMANSGYLEPDVIDLEGAATFL